MPNDLSGYFGEVVGFGSENEPIKIHVVNRDFEILQPPSAIFLLDK